jgi:Gram-negative bacterial TonB protein C-terminal
LRIATTRAGRRWFGILSSLAASQAAHAQAAPTTRCDSIVVAARVDTVPVAIFLRVQRLDGEFLAGQSSHIARIIATTFAAPRPFRLSVFSGGSQMRVLRRLSPDTAGELRAPTLTGVYRFTTTREGLKRPVETLRTSLVPGFDSAAADAIGAAFVFSDVRAIPDGDVDSMRVEARFSTDSTAGAYRLVSAEFPRMPVVDVVPRRDNPAAEFPASARDDSIFSGEVVLRFVVTPTGDVAAGTIEIVRATGLDFARSALVSLPAQHFSPATIHGCPVSQLVDYAFSFVQPMDGKPPIVRRRD